MSESHEALDGLCGAFLGISTVLLGLRGYARYEQKARWAADDWCMIPAYLLLVGLLASVLYGTYHRTLGYSTPVLKAEPVEPELSVAVNRAIDVFAAAANGCIKASALLFFQKVFCVRGRRDAFRLAIWVLLVLNCLWTLVYILLPIFQCGPDISHAWGPVTERAKYCHISNPYLESQSVTSVVFDLAILILPLPRIWSLKTTTSRRIAITAVFSTALVSLAASIAKAAIVFLIIQGKYTGDIQLSTTQAYFMWVLENCFAFVAVNLPSLVGLKNARGPEKMLASLRSFVSINSLRQSSEGTDHAATTGIKLRDRSSSSAAHSERAPAPSSRDLGLLPKSTSEHSAYASADGPRTSEQAGAGGEIRVTHDLSQSVEMV